ncbi:hypothetical protein WA026_015306 [Henosepilachna vigintioctopunctata]|uniref:Ribosomal protein n=1 Tax=Henosepilachna vigintioctopunctata TaxID=420089 RepID=A0AAW1TMR7_9CUCU
MLFLRNSIKLGQSCLNILLPAVKSFHTLNRPNLGAFVNAFQTSKFLLPRVVDFIPSCGFKVKATVRRRCKDCYIVKRQERWYNLCKTHPRHKQMSMKKSERKTWILTHATQGKVRPW